VLSSEVGDGAGATGDSVAAGVNAGAGGAVLTWPAVFSDTFLARWYWASTPTPTVPATITATAPLISTMVETTVGRCDGRGRRAVDAKLLAKPGPPGAKGLPTSGGLCRSVGLIAMPFTLGGRGSVALRARGVPLLDIWVLIACRAVDSAIGYGRARSS